MMKQCDRVTQCDVVLQCDVVMLSDEVMQCAEAGDAVWCYVASCLFNRAFISVLFNLVRYLKYTHRSNVTGRDMSNKVFFIVKLKTNFTHHRQK